MNSFERIYLQYCRVFQNAASFGTWQLPGAGQEGGGCSTGTRASDGSVYRRRFSHLTGYNLPLSTWRRNLGHGAASPFVVNNRLISSPMRIGFKVSACSRHQAVFEWSSRAPLLA